MVKLTINAQACGFSFLSCVRKSTPNDSHTRLITACTLPSAFTASNVSHRSMRHSHASMPTRLASIGAKIPCCAVFARTVVASPAHAYQLSQTRSTRAPLDPLGCAASGWTRDDRGMRTRGVL